MEHSQSSFISELPEIMAAIREKKRKLAGKKQVLLEAKLLGGDAESTKELEQEWGILELEIDLLEHTANVKGTNLEAEEMKLGVGTFNNLLLVNGKVEMDENLP